MQRLRFFVALVAMLALLPAGSAALAACLADAPHACCCEDDCPDGSLRVSKMMPCCAQSTTPLTPPGSPAQRTVEIAVAAVDFGANGNYSTIV